MCKLSVGRRTLESFYFMEFSRRLFWLKEIVKSCRGFPSLNNSSAFVGKPSDSHLNWPFRFVE